MVCSFLLALAFLVVSLLRSVLVPRALVFP